MTYQPIPQEMPPDNIASLIADCEFIAAACRENSSSTAKEIVQLVGEAKEILQKQATRQSNSTSIPEERT